MGLTYEQGDFTITQYGTSSKAEIKLDNAVGLAREKDGTFSMVGDFYHSHNQKLRRYYGNNQGFANDLATNYSVEQSKGYLEEQQFFCSENESAQVGKDGMIRMVYTRY